MTNQSTITASKCYYQDQLKYQERALAARDADSLIAPMPHTVSLAVNNTCFLRCKHCDVGIARRTHENEKNFFYLRTTGGSKKLQEIPLERFKELVDEIAPHGGVIRPAFLEPLLRKDLFELAAYTRDKGLRFSIQTNGVLLPKVYREVVDSGVVMLRVSLDGPAAIHDEIRGVPGTFAKAMDGIQKTLRYRDQNNLEAPIIGLSFVISGETYRYINTFMDTLAAEGILEEVFIAFSLLRFITPREVARQNAIDSEFFNMTESSISFSGLDNINHAVMVEELAQLSERFPRERYQYHFFPTELNRANLEAWFSLEDHFFAPEVTCHVPWSHCHIMYNGDVVVNGRCCSPALGNIMESSLEDIWNGPKAQAFRAKLLELGNFPVCNRCCRKLPDRLLE